MTLVDYRNTLATDLKAKRSSKRIPFLQKSGKQLAANLLQEQQKSENYKDSEILKYRSLLANNKQENFTKKFNKDIAVKLIKHGDSDIVAKHIDKFQGSDHNYIAKKLIDFGNGGYVAANLDTFQGVNHQEIALKIIKHLDGQFVCIYLDKFQGLDYQEIALKIIESKRGEYVALYLDKFQGVNYQEIAMKLFEHGKGRTIAQNLDKFQGLDQESIDKAIQHWEAESLKNLLKSDNKKTAKKPTIQQETTWEYIKKHPIVFAALVS